MDERLRKSLEQTVDDPDAPAASTSDEEAFKVTRPAGEAAGDVGESTSQGTRFRILRPHARGGLGEVFVAEDTELHREVALKQMQARHADNAHTRARFVLEAEITGGLEHPSIVPVYGLGMDANGRPFYAMRFVRGESFREAIAAHHAAFKRRRNSATSLDFRKLLGRFVNMCDAVAYAHSRGVLHRDLKPDNVMLGKFGETLVVDWGLAKALGERETPGDGTHADEHPLNPISEADVAATRMGTALGTPGYLSPEQATGRISDLTAATDIYSLGATLYYLLVNRPPIRGDDLRTVLERTERGQIKLPRHVDPRVPRGLQAICMKALATKPEDRYASVRALADDVEQWLADEPVSALREGAVVRMGRWMRKHRALVGSATVAIAMIAAVASVAAFAIDRARREAANLAEANGRLAATNRDLADTERKAREQAEQSAREADRQRNLSLDTLNALIYDVQDQLANRAGTQELMKRILDSARTRLVAIGETSVGANRQVDRLSAASAVKRAKIFVTLGSLDEAVKLYREASDDLTALVTADPSDAWARQVRSVAWSELAGVLQQQGDLSAARVLYEQSLAERRHLANEKLDDIDAQRDVANSCNGLGEILRQQGDLAAARKTYEESLGITERIAASRPRHRVSQRDLAVCSSRLGDVSLRQGDLAAAERYFRRDAEISQSLAASDPDDVQAQRDLMIAQDRLGDLLMKSDPSAARPFYERSLAICRALAEADSHNVAIQRDLSIAYNNMGDVAVTARNWKEAREFFERALAIIRTCAEKNPRDARARRDLSVASERLGDVMLELGDLPAALGHYEASAKISEQLAAADSANAQAQRDWTVTLNKLGMIAARSDAWDRARNYYARALAVRKRLAEADSANAEIQHDLAISHFRMAGAYHATSNYAEAEAAYRAAIAVMDQMIAAGMLVELSKAERELVQASLDACLKAAHESSEEPAPGP